MSMQDIDMKASAPVMKEPANRAPEQMESGARAKAVPTQSAQSGRRGQIFVPRLVVLGIGGAGGNVVNNLIAGGLQNVDFIVANTDMQDLEKSAAPIKIQLGVQKTEGLGTGANPELGKLAAEESIEEVMRHLDGTHLLFLTAGMGGGTGTGATSVIAQRARDMGILTFGMFTKPFEYEGLEKMRIAEAAIAQLKDEVDKLVVISNQNLFALANEQTTLAEGFLLADKVLSSGIAGITETIMRLGQINMDFADVRTVMQEKGRSMLGTGEGEGPERAIEAVSNAIENRLVDDVRLAHASTILLNITGDHITMHETHAISERLQEEAGAQARLLMGVVDDPDMAGKIKICLMAAGIKGHTSDTVMRSVPAPDDANTPPAPKAAGGDMPDHEPTTANESLDLAPIAENLPAAIQPRSPDEALDKPRKHGLLSFFFQTSRQPIGEETDLPDAKTGWFNKLVGNPEETEKINTQYDIERTGRAQSPAPQPAEAYAEPEPHIPAPPSVAPVAAAPTKLGDMSANHETQAAPAEPIPPAMEEPLPPKPVPPKVVSSRPASPLDLDEKRYLRGAQQGAASPKKPAQTMDATPDNEQLEIPAFLRRQNS